MRIYEHYKKVIKTEVTKQFGEESKVFLFGSRIDDALKGGDLL